MKERETMIMLLGEVEEEGRNQLEAKRNTKVYGLNLNLFHPSVRSIDLPCDCLWGEL